MIYFVIHKTNGGCRYYFEWNYCCSIVRWKLFEQMFPEAISWRNSNNWTTYKDSLIVGVLSLIFWTMSSLNSKTILKETCFISMIINHYPCSKCYHQNTCHDYISSDVKVKTKTLLYSNVQYVSRNITHRSIRHNQLFVRSLGPNIFS